LPELSASETSRPARIGAVLFRNRGWLPVPFLLAPLLAVGVWTAYEQLHDLVWWRVHPLCPTCRRSYAIAQRPKPGMVCPCCDTPLYPLRTPQDYKAMVLITAIIVIALPVYAVWAALVAKLS